MAQAETNINNLIIQGLFLKGVRLWKNLRGMFKTLDGKRKVMAGFLALYGTEVTSVTLIA